MKQDILKNENLIESSSQYAKTVLEELLKIGKDFFFVVNTEFIEFERKEIVFKEKQIRLDIVGYSFETFEIHENFFNFRAGFNWTKGTIESGVKIDYKGVQQIVIDEKQTVFVTFVKPEKKQDRKTLFMQKNMFNKK
ncbi:hypothetical protein ThvES_00016100 [Thiovulum sp. ES]|nr:hypothetical protein ThvES_00016100 [Thiovulum sp. ES]